MKKRNEIDEKYKWDLSCYVKDGAELEENFKYLTDNIARYKDFYGKFGNKEVLMQYLKFDEEYSSMLYRTSMFIGHTLNTDTSNTKFLNYTQRLEFISKDCSEASAYIAPQLSDLDDEYLNQLIKDPQLCEYRRFFKNILRNKKLL